MPSIPDSFIDDLLLRVDLHDLLGRYISLKKTGSRYMGVCPFHGDSDPSLSVNPDKGFWYCFGCQTGGDAITFIRKQENLDFVEAIKFIAGLYNIPVPETEVDPKSQRRKILIDINDKAAEFYVKILKSKKYGASFREYLTERGFKKDTVLDYRLGASIDGWEHLANHLRDSGYSDQDLIDAGVALPRNSGRGIYDRFRGRLMIPIIDTLDRTLGFGARAMGDDQPKYINSPESPVFLKSKVLFGLNLAKKECRKTGQLILMEGYTDVMHARQAGVHNCCAVMGTALTSEHLPQLARFAGEVVLSFDSDEAGQRATTKSLMAFAGSDFKVKVMPIPPGNDPADIIIKKGAENFKKRVAASVDASDWLFRIYGKPVVGGSITEKLEAFALIAPYIEAYRNHPIYDQLQENAAIAFNTNISALRTVLRQVRDGERRGRGKTETKAESVSIDLIISSSENVERELFLSLMASPKYLLEVKEMLSPEDFDNPLHRRLARVFFQPGFALGTAEGLKRIREITDDEDLYSYVVGLTVEHDEDQLLEDKSRFNEGSLRMCLLNLVKRQYNSECNRLQGELQVCMPGLQSENSKKVYETKKQIEQLQMQRLELDDTFFQLCANLGGDSVSREPEISD